VVAGLGIIQLLPPFPGVPWGRHVLGVPLIVFGAIVAVTASSRDPAAAQYGHSPARRLRADGRLANSRVSLVAKTALSGRMKQGPPHV